MTNSRLLSGCVLGMAACASRPDAPSPATGCEGAEIVVAASDISSALICGAPRCEAGPRTTGTDLGRDPALSSSNGRTFFLARENAVIFEVDPSCGVPVARHFLYDAMHEGSSNPHDVAVAPDGSLFVALYDQARIAILKDGKASGSVDLSTFDPDGNPQAESIRIVQVDGKPKAFVALERLDDNSAPMRFASKLPSFMLRIDVATQAVEQTIELAGRNPFNPMVEYESALFLAEPRDFDSASESLAGIERFDTATSTTRLLVGEAAFGGSVVEVAVTNGCGVALAAGPAHGVNPTSLVTFDPTTGAALTTTSQPVYGPTEGFDLRGLAWKGQSLFVGDRRRGPSGYPIHVFERSADSCVLHANPTRDLVVPLPPVALRPAATR